MKRLLPVVLLLPLALPGPAARAATIPLVATLRTGGSAFWSATAAPYDGERGVRRYAIRVAGSARQLRVAFDQPDFRVGYGLALYDPAGKPAGWGGGWMSSEIVVPSPRPGVWVATVSADPEHTEFRLRARLDGALPPKPRRPVALLPNLRLVPPYEFTFSSDVTLARDTGGPSAGPLSCNADDTAEHQAVRCLRFSLGPSNVGAGPMELRFAAGQGLVLPGEVTQIVHWSDGRVTERSAGTFEYHKTHMHYHHTGFGTLELLRVDDLATGAMTKVGEGPKQGFCTGDVMLAEWRSFANSRQFSAESTCLDDYGPYGNYDPSAGTQMGLSAGWADIYSWEQDGNYVDFGLNGDGRYVVRSTADAMGNILESDETDNTAYSYIEVTGTTVRVLERGRGQGPWDRRKVLVHDGVHPTAA